MEGLKRTTENKKAKLVGRGGARGKTSGRGTKGQKARAGHKIRPHIRDIIKKLPKLRGRGKNVNKAFRTRPAVVNLALINKSFEANTRITPKALLDRGFIKRTNGVLPMVKILGTGDVTKVFTFHECIVSKAAQEKITKAGGMVLG